MITTGSNWRTLCALASCLAWASAATLDLSIASNASVIWDLSSCALSVSTLRRSVAAPSSTLTSSSRWRALSNARAKSARAVVSRLGLTRFENSWYWVSAVWTAATTVAITSRAVSATRDKRARSPSRASTWTLKRPSFSALEANSVSCCFSSARARADCSLAVVSWVLACASSALVLSITELTLVSPASAASLSATSSTLEGSWPEPPRITDSVRTSPCLVITTRDIAFGSALYSRLAAARSSTITTFTKLARMPEGASTTSTAFLAPEIWGRLTGLILLSISATTSSTRPPLLAFRCSMAESASSLESATIASANVPSAEAIAAS